MKKKRNRQQNKWVPTPFHWSFHCPENFFYIESFRKKTDDFVQNVLFCKFIMRMLVILISLNFISNTYIVVLFVVASKSNFLIPITNIKVHSLTDVCCWEIELGWERERKLEKLQWKLILQKNFHHPVTQMNDMKWRIHIAIELTKKTRSQIINKTIIILFYMWKIWCGDLVSHKSRLKWLIMMEQRH